MLSTTPEKQFTQVKSALLKQISGTFPIKDPKGQFEVHVEDLEVDDQAGVDDIEGQQKAREEGRTWDVPVRGSLVIRDGKGKVLARRENHTITRIPKMTRHYTYIVGGQERTLANQWRLRPGPFVRPMANREGEFMAQFQMDKGPRFDIKQDPATGVVIMDTKNRKIPMYSVLQSQGISDAQMEKMWGKEVFEANKGKARPEKNLRSLFEAWTGKPMPEKADPSSEVARLFRDTHMDAAVAEANLGVNSDRVTPQMLFNATRKLQDVSAGRVDPDPVDSLKYKELWTAGDHFVDRLKSSREDVSRRVQTTLSKPSIQKALLEGSPSSAVLRDILPQELFKRPVYHAFAATGGEAALSSNGDQTNPISLLSDHSLTTVMGPGGLKSKHGINEDSPIRSVDPSHLGFLDPVFTPEGEVGLTTHLAAGVKIKNRVPHVKLFDLKTGSFKDVDAATAHSANVVFPDQVTWEKGKPKPTSKVVRMSASNGDIKDMDFSKARYVLPSTAQVFATETNLVPFMQNDSAGRTTMSARHIGQSISVEGREAPLVQVGTGGGSDNTFEKIVGSNFLAVKAPVDGTVTKVEPKAITIKDAKGKEHRVGTYDHYPTNHSKGMLHNEPLVKVGDSVKAKQVLADNNFTKNGELAVGTNLRVAYMANGFNHEDGIVVSESAAQKLRSTHLNKPTLFAGNNTHISKKKFINQKGTVYNKDQLNGIGDDGVIKPGTKVRPGDPLILALNEKRTPKGVGADVRKVGNALKNPFSNGSLTWDSDYEGEVVKIGRRGKNVIVYVKTSEPLQEGAKMSTRHSAKGIVTKIIPDAEMPHDANGEPVQMLLNTVSVPGRMNPGQVLETAAGKIAKKTGKPYIINNFEPGVDYLEKVKSDLKKHGLKDTEALYDPETGRKLGEVMVGHQYVMQLEHQIDKKTTVRGGGTLVPEGSGAPKLRYDAETHQPSRGGKHGGQALGSLGVYGMLAAGLENNLAEMQTLKSDQDQAEELWGAITNGERLPPPKIPYAYKKFEATLRGAGLNLEKNGTKIRILPSTDEETRARSRGAIKNPDLTLRGKDDKPEKGGLFDIQTVGGQDAHHWTHIELANPLPHPMFIKPIALSLGINEKDVPKIIEGSVKLPNGKTGTKAIKEALAGLDVKKRMEEVKTRIDNPKVKGPELQRMNTLYKSLRVLDEKGLKPSDAWTIQAVPVLPSMFRPQTTLADGTAFTSPVNQLYRRIGMANNSLRHAKDAGVDTPADDLGVFNELRGMMGVTAKSKKSVDLDPRGRDSRDKRLAGLLHGIEGEQPKDGYFQKKLVGVRQDYTARSTITVDPGLSADEIGVPKKIAAEMMRPLVAGRLIRAGYDGITAHKMISQKHPVAMKALEQEAAQRPVIMKRDPVLHQYSLVGQKMKLTDEKAIRVSPLVLPPIGGDIDGDAVGLFVPVTKEAVEEVKQILPSQRTISGSSGELLSLPANESALALHRASMVRGNKKALKFANLAEANKAFSANKFDLQDAVTIGGKTTTLGRARVAAIAPKSMQADILKIDPKRPIDREMQKQILKEVAKTDPKNLINTTDRLSQLGFQMAYESGHTVSLKDLEPLRAVRNKIVADAKRKADPLSVSGRHDDATAVWQDATKKLHKAYDKHFTRHPTNVSDMRAAGIKAKTEQFQGLVGAPMLVQDYKGNASKVPVTKSFAEGIDLGGYFLQAQGARRGLAQKTGATSKPGYMSKLLMQNMVDQKIESDDCGATQGIHMSAGDKDVVDRFLAAPLKVGSVVHPAGTVVTPELLREVKSGKLIVRSPLKCRLPKGVCAKCIGKHPSGREYEMGANIGAISAQALGERGTQIMLKQTHGAGILPVNKVQTDSFETVNKLLSATKRTSTDAGVSPVGGKVIGVTKERHGGWSIQVEGSRKPVYSRQKPLVTVGTTVAKGTVMTEGVANPHDVLKTKGIDAWQQDLANRLGTVFSSEGVLKRHAELAVRNTAGVMEVTDAGDHPSILRGDHVLKTVLDDINRNLLRGKRQIKYKAKYVSMNTQPSYVQQDWQGRLQGEKLKETLIHAARTGMTSSTAHPIARLARGGFKG